MDGMGFVFNGMDFDVALEQERGRVVRLCAWITGDPAVADDLAQETLIAAWKGRDGLRDPQKLGAWLTTIARNTCLGWLRRNRREQARTAFPIDALDEPDADAGEADSLEVDLDRQGLARLLDRALGLLPPETAHILTAHYIEETAQAEIAAQMGVKPGTLAVRLQRGRLAFQRVLRSDLRDEALAMGLIDGEADGTAWQPTGIWCPVCGAARLEGRLRREPGGGEFLLRCPRCDRDPQAHMSGLDLSVPAYAALLGSVTSFKPAYTRLIRGTAGYFQEAMRTGEAACLACGKPAVVQVTQHKWIKSREAQEMELFATCPECGWGSNKTLSSMALAAPEIQRFWKANPRIRMLPYREVEAAGGPALVSRFVSVTGAAEIAVVSRKDTLVPIAVHGGDRL